MVINRYANLAADRNTAFDRRGTSDDSGPVLGEIADEGVVNITIGGSASGVIDFAGDDDTLTVNLVAGQTYLVSMRGTGNTPLLDPLLTLSLGGTTVSDDDGGAGTYSLLTFTAATSGTYNIQAEAFGSATGGYTIDVRHMGTDSVVGDLTTTTDLALGTTFGFLETSSDIDMYRIELTAGQYYTFELAGGADYASGYPPPAGEIDTFLTIYDSVGNAVVFNDDIDFPDDVSSALGFVASVSGTYYVQVHSLANSGGYTLTANQIDLSLYDPLDSIDWGSQLASNAVSVYFAPEGEVYDGVTSMGWSAYEISRAMAALATWAAVTNLTFTQTANAAGATFHLVTTESDEFLGYFNPPDTGPESGVGVFAVNGTGWDDTGGLEQGGYGFITLIHEFGHGLGLAHPHDFGGSSDVMLGVTSPFDSYGMFDLNQGVYTTMSYNDGWPLHPDAVGGFPPGNPIGYGHQGGPGAFDIAVVQANYGADPLRNPGTTTYTLPQVNAAGTFWTTIWDTSGTDTIVNPGSTASLIDLTAATLDYSATGGGVVSFVDGVFGGFTIANGVVIENATGGGGGDTLIGNAAVNTLTGMGGADWMDGRGGADTMRGGAGDDRYIVDSAGDQAIEIAGEGTDTVESSVTFTLGVNVENLTLTGGAAINGTGNTLVNTLIGNAAANTLNGGVGTDSMYGGGGNDRYIVDNTGDAVVEAAGAGTDTVESSETFTLGVNVENLTLTGAGVVNGTGNSGTNILIGNGAANILNGGTGADSLQGGLGNDRYVVDDLGDVVVELAAAGTDTVESSVTHTLGVNVENLTLTGAVAINGTGNTLANVLIGNGAANILNGGTGADSLQGGLGNDRYVVDNIGDVVVELAAAGTDTVESSLTYTLGANVENLTLTGAVAINGTGNTLANILIGNGAANILNGGTGADSLQGGLGNDRYVVDNIGDAVVEAAGAGTDTVESSVTFTLSVNVENLTLTGAGVVNGTGNALANILIGNGAANILNGGTGADSLQGGLGNDRYVVDNIGDVVVELAAAGTDTVESSVTHTLGVNVENLTLTGAVAINGTGNTLANVLIGNGAANILNGGTGADSLQGGLGNDRYVVDNIGDVVVELAAAGTDTVESSLTYTLGANVENLTLTGAVAVNGTGNTLANILIGNGAANILNGGTGADSLQGGLGNDRYIVDNIGDAVVEAAGAGTDTVESSVTHTLGVNVENLTLTGAVAINGTGNTLANVLIGNGAANILNGGTGADSLQGGLGNDRYVVDNIGDVVVELAAAGTDTVESSLTYTLGANVENLTLTGAVAVNGTGNTLANILIGNGAANILNGGTGADSLQGGLGNDRYIVDNIGDAVVEAAGAGTDTVESSLTYTLGANVENLTLTGAVAINGTGNTLANILIGNGAANILNGGTGADSLQGGLGNDRYVVDNIGDVVVELAAAGTDTVESSLTYTLGANVENLTLTGAVAINGTGNTLANILIGNGAANILNGGTGADSLQGGLGNDRYVVDNIGDAIVEAAGAGTDTVESSVTFTLSVNVENLTLTGAGVVNGTGNTLANILIGNGAANILNGGTGADSLQGGLGNDRYIVDNIGDAVVEAAGAGTDTVESSVTHTLGVNVENLTLTGAVAVNGTGNTLANILIGNGAANSLNGGAGQDTLTGGNGTDRFYFDATPVAGLQDTITDFVVVDDSIFLDRDIFTGIAANGVLAASAFCLGTAAADADDRIVYDQATGNIYYDADGTGGTAAVLFAQVTSGTALTQADFFGYL